MTIKRTQARPYAKAAFATASEKSDLAGWMKSLGNLAQLVEQPEVKKIIQNQTLATDVVAKVLIEAMRGFLSDETKQFIAVLAEAKRLLLLPEIYELYLALKAEAEKTLDVQVTSAVPMSAQQEQNLIANLTKKFSRTVAINTKVDPSILGGLIVRAGNRVIDASLKGQLNQLEESLGVHHGI